MTDCATERSLSSFSQYHFQHKHYSRPLPDAARQRCNKLLTAALIGDGQHLLVAGTCGSEHGLRGLHGAGALVVAQLRHSDARVWRVALCELQPGAPRMNKPDEEAVISHKETSKHKTDQKCLARHLLVGVVLAPVVISGAVRHLQHLDHLVVGADDAQRLPLAHKLAWRLL